MARECSWRATTPVTWITFTSSVEGQGDGTIAYRVAENPDPVARQASIAVADRQVPLAQQAAPCRYSVGAPSSVVADSGGEQSIEIATHSACSWTAASDQPWASVSPSSGQGDAVVRVVLAANTGPAREADVIVAGERVVVRQNAFVAPAPPPAPTPAPTPPPPSPPPPPPPSPTPPPPSPTPPPPSPPPPAPTPPPPSPTPPPPTPPPPAPAPTPPPPTPPPPTPPSPSPRTPVRAIELDGEIEKLAGACPSWTFELEDRSVYTTQATAYERGPCKKMKNGTEIELRGTLMSDGTVLADRIRYDDEDDDEKD